MSSLKILAVLTLLFIPLHAFSQNESGGKEGPRKGKKVDFELVFKSEKFEIHQLVCRFKNGSFAMLVKSRLIYPFFSNKDFKETMEICNRKVKELFSSYKLDSVKYFSDTKVESNDTIPAGNIKIWCLLPDKKDGKPLPAPIPNAFKEGYIKVKKELSI